MYGLAKCWLFQDATDLFSGHFYNMTDPLACLNIERNYYSTDELTISYNDKGLVDKIYDEEQRVRYTCQYDKNGNLIRRTNYDLPMLKNEWENNRLLSSTLYKNNGYEEKKYSFVWNSNNSYKIDNDNPAYHFDNNGKLLRISWVYSGKTTKEKIFKYDTQGRLQETELIYSKSYWEIKSVLQTYKYDKNNNIVSYHEITKTKNVNTGKIVQNENTVVWDYEYDNYGNWTKRTMYYISKGDIEIKTKGYMITREIEYYK